MGERAAVPAVLQVPSPPAGISACSQQPSKAVGCGESPGAASVTLSSGFAGGAAIQPPVLAGFFHVDRGCFGGVTGSGAVPWHPGEAGLTLARTCSWQHCRV